MSGRAGVLDGEWKLPTDLGSDWKLPDGTLSPHAQRILRAYNDLGYVPNVRQGGVIQNVRFRTPKPEFDEEG